MDFNFRSMSFNSNNEIYHGNIEIIRYPKVIISGSYKDFGYSFYCTRNRRQADKWAETRSRKHPKHARPVVNKYFYKKIRC